MNQAVSYAYARASSARPSLFDQFGACRAYAQAHDYRIVGEYNDIDTPSHPNQWTGLANVLSLLADDPALVVLLYEPDADVLERLAGHNARVESVSGLAQRSASA